ncbi:MULTISPECIES: hypothetical protein [unclassified Streptomyces]|uniref:hypothetical protein n=1 Tax=unclassified Streptomyces TaxID=2593676 RepID=UPI0009394ECF|nr:hypothetical protein [Streptomyces sp. CB02400]OKK12554.1 hypothetical protein AMK33_06645 [Streptomyces sp. CB02400]
MFISKKIAATVGALGGIVLAGVGAGQAFAESEPAKCVEESNGNVRCVQVSEYVFTNKDGKYQVVNKQSVTCSGAGELSCNSFATLPAEKKS